MSDFIDNLLKPLAFWYLRPEIEEIAINRPGEVWLRQRKPGPGDPIWTAEADPELTLAYILDVCHALANQRDITFDERQLPVLYTTLPGGHRFTAIVGPAVVWENDSTEGAALAIRQYRPDIGIGFEDYAAPMQERPPRPTGTLTIDEALEVIRRGGSALIGGATSTGKTTFLNIILHKVIPTTHRLVALQDTPEIVFMQPNRVPVLISRTEGASKLNYKMVVDLVVRLTPDVTLTGEVSTSNAGAVAELMETGHKNFLATIHGDSAAGSIRAFMQRLAHTRPNMPQNAVLDMLAGGFDITIHLDRSGSARSISEVRWTSDVTAEIRAASR